MEFTSIAIKVIIFVSLAFWLGRAVLLHGFHVGYSRKILHFSMLFVPVAIDSSRGISAGSSLSLMNIFTNAVLTLGLLSLFMANLRARFTFLEQAFHSIDRPEDRPYTLFWLVSQAAIAYLIMLMAVVLIPPPLLEPSLLIPLSVIAFGDGLAEPIGVRFGKHKYRTTALFSKNTYVRSIEGSLCVFIATILAVLWYRSHFNDNQFVILLLMLPLLMTLTEAKSPHTWDTPFLLVVGISTIYSINFLF